MADFNALQAIINAYIKKNGVQAITGQILNGVLTGMVNALGKGWTIAGEAGPTTDPGVMTGPVAYIAHEAGTYTHFDNLVVDQGEVAMLIFNENTWTKNVLASLAANATVDDQVGTPQVGVSFVNGVLSFDFRNMKGDPGDAAGFGTINATVDSNIGTPGVSVQTSGPDTAKNMTFQFTNLKGETGVTSVVVTVDNTSGTPACAVSLVGQELHLDFTGLKGAQGNTGVSADYPIAIINNLTTSDPTSALSAEQGVVLQGEISQLEHKVDGSPQNYVEGKRLSYLSGGYVDSADHGTSDFIPYSSGNIVWTYITSGRTNSMMAFYNANKEYIADSYFPGPADETVKTITQADINTYAPGAAFARFCFVLADKNQVSYVNGDTTYTPSTGTQGLTERVEDLEQSAEAIPTLTTKVSGLETSVNGIDKYLYKIPESLWENGGLNTTTGENSGDATNRLRLVKPLFVKKGTVISIGGYGKVGIYYFATPEISSFINYSSLSTADVTIANDTFIRILRAAPDNADITVGNTEFGKVTDATRTLYCNIADGVNYITRKVDIEYGTLLTLVGNAYIGNSTEPYLNAFFGNFRTSKYLKGTFVKIVFAGCTPYVYEYDQNFNAIRRYTINSGDIVELTPRVAYIKVAGAITDESTFAISFYGDISEVFNNRRTDVCTFLYRAFPSNGRNVFANNSADEQYSTTKYCDSGILRLPPSYSVDGKPTKLILWCQSSGEYGSMVSQSLSDNYAPYHDFLAKNGYAILSCYGWTTKYGDPRETSYAGHLPATPTTMASIRNAYDWVCRNFNIDRGGVYISCKSFGGIFASAMAFQNVIPVRAIGLLAPELSAKKLRFGYAVSSKLAYCADMAFTNYSAISNPDISDADFNAICTENARLFPGYESPMTAVIDKTPSELATVGEQDAVMGTVKRVCRTPVKIWIAQDDSAVYYDASRYFVESIVNAGGLAELRTMPNNTGGHHAVDSDANALKVTSITTPMGYVCENIPLAYVELADWFNQH